MKQMRFVLFLLLLGFSVSAFSLSPVEIYSGSLKLIAYPDSGNFSLYQLSDKGKNRYEPLFEDRNTSATSWFSVSFNEKNFKLGKKIGKKIEFDQLETGVRFTFTLTDDFQVVQTITFDKYEKSTVSDLLKVTTVIENTSGKEALISLKYLLDTMLGENEGIHFFTDVRNRISTETRLEQGKDPDSLIVSKKGSLSLMLFLNSKLITNPQYLYVSNWERLNTLTWLPDFVEGRSFNSLYSINDSALLFVWPEKKVLANRFYTTTLLMGPYYPERLALITSDASSKERQALAALSTNDSKLLETAQTVLSGATNLNRESKLVLLEQIIQRIDQITLSPFFTFNEELEQLNQTLDMLYMQLEE